METTFPNNMLKVCFQIASCTKISKLNIMVKVVKLFTGVCEKATLMNVIGKHLCRSLFFKKVSCLQAKERLLHRFFPMSFTKYFRTLFFVKLLQLNTLFFPLRRPQSQKMFSSILVILNIFEIYFSKTVRK